MLPGLLAGRGFCLLCNGPTAAYICLVPVHSHSCAGVVRNLKSRDGWAKQWTKFMEQPLLPAPANIKFASGLDARRLMSAAELGVAGDPKPEAIIGEGSRMWAGKDASRRASVRCSASAARSFSRCPLPCGVPVTRVMQAARAGHGSCWTRFWAGGPLAVSGRAGQGRAGQGRAGTACLCLHCTAMRLHCTAMQPTLTENPSISIPPLSHHVRQAAAPPLPHRPQTRPTCPHLSVRGRAVAAFHHT